MNCDIIDDVVILSELYNSELSSSESIKEKSSIYIGYSIEFKKLIALKVVYNPINKINLDIFNKYENTVKILKYHLTDDIKFIHMDLTGPTVWNCMIEMYDFTFDDIINIIINVMKFLLSIHNDDYNYTDIKLENVSLKFENIDGVYYNNLNIFKNDDADMLYNIINNNRFKKRDISNIVMIDPDSIHKIRVIKYPSVNYNPREIELLPESIIDKHTDIWYLGYMMNELFTYYLCMPNILKVESKDKEKIILDTFSDCMTLNDIKKNKYYDKTRYNKKIYKIYLLIEKMMSDSYIKRPIITEIYDKFINIIQNV